jgi:hypothetical protein
MWLSASKTVFLAGLSLAALTVGTASHALAQESIDSDLRLETTTEEDSETVLNPSDQLPQNPAITIGDDTPAPLRRRQQPVVDPYEPLGLRRGAFTLFPTLEIGSGVQVERDGATRTDTTVITRVRPGLRAQSDWSRHQITVSGDARLDYEFGSEDAFSVEGNADAALRLDVKRGTTADLRLRYQAIEPDISSSSSALEHTITASTALTHDLGGIEARVKTDVTRRLFADTELAGGGTQDNGDRNYTELSLALRGGLTRDALLTPFGEVAYEPRFYDDKRDRNGIARSSHGLRLTAGLTIADDPIWTGEVAANLLYRTYDDSVLDDVFAPGLSAAITWRPTDLTRFQFNADVSLTETITAGESTTARWSAGYTVSHDLRENLTVSAGVSLAKETGGNETLSLGTELGLSWALNRNVVFGVAYNGDYVYGTPDRQEHSLIGSIILRR